jgi:hypothetical protein
MHDECVTEIKKGRRKEEDSNRETELRGAKNREKKQMNHERQPCVEEVSDDDVNGRDAIFWSRYYAIRKISSKHSHQGAGYGGQ